MLKRLLFLLACFFAALPFLNSQITTGSIVGVVTDEKDQPLVGATITGVHVPSGTKYTTTSKAGGQYTLQNLRVGGPYTVTITFVGFEKMVYDEIYVRLAEPYFLNAAMVAAATELQQVILTTTSVRNPILNANRTGAVTNVGRREIERLPTISRSINEITRLTPQANGPSVAGGNYRQNNFTIDGAYFNNSFGIGQNLPANGSPISIDAIEEISVNITPFDVRQSGFIGSAINAVTRSGTNTFSASAYRYFRSEKHQGDKVGKTTFVKAPFEFRQHGGRVSGPIVKDKLFFFLNYERENQPKQIQSFVAATAAAPFGSSPNVARPTRGELDAISQYLLQTYGYVTGPYDNYSTEIKRVKIMGRIDWNIAQGHKFNIRYSQVEGGEPQPPSTSTTGSGYTFPTGQGRTNNNALWFSNSQYFQGANFYSLAAELNSNIGKFANTLRATYTFQNDSRSTPSQIFPFVDIMKDGTPFTSFGYELFSYGNLRKVKTYSIVDNLSWVSNKHHWLIGGQVDWSETINGFMRFGTGLYRFASWDDFVNGNKPTDYALTYSLEPGYAQAFPKFNFTQYSLYGQDEIHVNKKFRLTLGLRLDLPTYPLVPEQRSHPLVAQLTFADGKKFDTKHLPKESLLWSPRIGFNYDLYGDRSLQLRGGTGIFTGNVPFVWIVSQVGDAGMLQITQSWNGVANTPGPFNPDPRAYLPPNPPVAGSILPNAITIIDNNFKMPQTWKTSVAMDKRFPWNMVFTLEAIYNKDLNTALFINENLAPPAPLNVANYPDRRLIYAGPNNLKFLNPITSGGQPVANGASNGTGAFNVTRLGNGDKGHYASLTAKLEKQFRGGIFASVAYTKSFANNLYDGSGDQPLSAWQLTANINGNNIPRLGYANFVIPDRVTAVFSIKKEYIRHLATNVSIFFNGGIEGRFSYVYGADFNRDGVNGNDLIYIPRDPSEIDFATFTYPNGVTYTAQQQKDMFFAYIEQDKYLRKHKGQYAERNGAQLPWRNQVDVKFAQDIFTNIGKERNTLQFTIDIFNFGNLLNPNWGKQKSINASSLLVPMNMSSWSSAAGGGTVRPTFRLQTDRNAPVTETFRDNVSIFSTYYMQFGFRYLLN